jgi:hypothetical protein
MTDQLNIEKVFVLNNIYNNTIIENKTGLEKPKEISTKLYEHQWNMVQEMHLYREKMIRGFMIKNEAINGKIGIIGDPVGTGKSLTVLSYLASYKNKFPQFTCELTSNSSKYFFSHQINKLSDASSANLIIVPHYLYGQWKNEIDHHTTMKYVSLETKRVIKGDELAKQMIQSHFVITTNKCYKYVQEYANQHQIEWNNIFVDEASSIYMNSSDPPLQFQFLWLITNNWIPLLFKNSSIQKHKLNELTNQLEIHRDFKLWLMENPYYSYDVLLESSSFLKDYLPFHHHLRYMTVLRNSNQIIESSISLPNMIMEDIQCRPNLTLNSLISYCLSRKIEPKFDKDRIPYLFQGMGIEFKSVMDYLPFQIGVKHSLIKRKVEENECVICLEPCEYPTILDCCYNLYCGKCILRNIYLQNNKCPLCRELITVDRMCCLVEKGNEEVNLLKNKQGICLELFRKEKDGKFIIFSSFDNIYYELFEEIDRLGLKAERIENNLFSLLKTIKNFKDGVTNIIFVSNINLIRGLSMEFVSHLIFYHDQLSCELKEILIHSAQRIGRKKPLKILQLHSEIPI